MVDYWRDRIWTRPDCIFLLVTQLLIDDWKRNVLRLGVGNGNVRVHVRCETKREIEVTRNKAITRTFPSGWPLIAAFSAKQKLVLGISILQLLFGCVSSKPASFLVPKMGKTAELVSPAVVVNCSFVTNNHDFGGKDLQTQDVSNPQQPDLQTHRSSKP